MSFSNFLAALLFFLSFPDLGDKNFFLNFNLFKKLIRFGVRDGDGGESDGGERDGGGNDGGDSGCCCSVDTTRLLLSSGLTLLCTGLASKFD